MKSSRDTLMSEGEKIVFLSRKSPTTASLISIVSTVVLSIAQPHLMYTATTGASEVSSSTCRVSWSERPSQKTQQIKINFHPRSGMPLMLLRCTYCSSVHHSGPHSHHHGRRGIPVVYTLRYCIETGHCCISELHKKKQYILH